jgi:peptidoglycan/LPS O-acetylase OafA/YrhL
MEPLTGQAKAISYVGYVFELTGAGARACKFLGAISYALYAVHDPLFHALQAIAGRENIVMSYYAPWAGLGFLFLLTGLCWLLDTVYDWPIRRFLQRRVLS